MKWFKEYREEWAILGLLVLLLLTFLLCGCAIPVRPIAKIEPGADGKPHFVADPEQEPHPNVGGWLEGGLSLAGVLTGAGGIAGVGVTLLRNMRLKRALGAAVAFGNDMTGANTDAEAEAVKMKHAIQQSSLGVKGIIDQTIEKVST